MTRPPPLPAPAPPAPARAGRPRVLLLALGNGARLPAWLDALGRLGLESLLASCLGPRLSPAPRPGFALPAGPAPLALAGLAATARRLNVAAVLAADGASLEPAAELARRLGLPGPCPPPPRPPALLRQRLLNAGLPVPRFRTLDPDRPLAGQLAGLRFPCVLRGPRGGRRADSAWELARLCRGLRGRRRRGLLVEEFIWGRETWLLGLLAQGRLRALALCDRVEPDAGWVAPSRLPSPLQEAALVCAQRACLALGLDTGLVYVDSRINRAGVWLLGVTAGPGSGPRRCLLEAITGSSAEALTLAGLLSLPLPTAPPGAVGVTTVPAPRRAVLRRVEGLWSAARQPLVQEVSLNPANGAGLLCLIQVRAPAADLAEAALRAARGCLRVITAPDRGA